MPQYEVQLTPGAPPLRVRARDAEDAVRRATAQASGDGVAVNAVTLGAAEPGSWWREASIGGHPWGRVREHSRMRFRRD